MSFSFALPILMVVNWEGRFRAEGGLNICVEDIIFWSGNLKFCGNTLNCLGLNSIRNSGPNN